MRFALLLPAAGSGVRLGDALPKAMIEVGGEPMFVRAVRPFLTFDECVEVIIAAPASRLSRFSEECKQLDDARVRCVAGGATRQESVGLALNSVVEDVKAVLVHDAARPMVTPELIRRTLSALDDGFAAAVPGVATHDTLKMTDETRRRVEKTLPRERVYAVQTPQAIRIEAFRAAHERARAEGLEATDDVGLIELFALGAIAIVAGDDRNFKITTPFDLERARRLIP